MGNHIFQKCLWQYHPLRLTFSLPHLHLAGDTERLSVSDPGFITCAMLMFVWTWLLQLSQHHLPHPKLKTEERKIISATLWNVILPDERCLEHRCLERSTRAFLYLHIRVRIIWDLSLLMNYLRTKLLPSCVWSYVWICISLWSLKI